MTTVDRLRQLVLDGSEPRQKLPSEGKLAESLGVSRLTIREALKELSGKGLVELHRGKTAVVREPDSVLLSDYFKTAIQRDSRRMFELLEIRRALEGLATELAAKNGSRAAISAIEASLDEMSLALESGLDSSASDVSFHEALALASGNRMLAFILEGLADALLETFKLSAQGRKARGGEIKETLNAHRVIFEFVKRGDAKSATKSMSSHLKDAEYDLNSAIRASGDENKS